MRLALAALLIITCSLPLAAATAKDLVGVILMQRNTGGPAADLADEVNIFMAMAAAAVDR